MEERSAVATKSDMYICPICVEPVLDGIADSDAQDVLFCEGASITKAQYTVLSDSTEPFLCPSCTAANQQTAVLGLRECLNALADEVRVLKATVATLQKQTEKAEILELKATVAALQRAEDRGSTSGTRSTSNNAAWNVVAARGSLKKNGSQRRDVNAGSRQHTQGAGSEEIATTSNKPRSTRKRIPVKGARLVWGTVKTATAIAVKTTISSSLQLGKVCW